MDRKTYREVLDRYDRAKAFGEQRSLAEYAQHLNDLYQTDAFSEGLRDGPWTRFSTRVDQELEPFTKPTFGAVGREVGGVFGHAEAGEKVGTGLPRALLQTAPLYFLNPGAGLLATGSALGATGALFAGQTYADTGSPKAALISGGTAAAMPLVGRFGGNLGARAFGGQRVAGTIEDVVNTPTSRTVTQRAINEVLPATAADVFRTQLGRFGGSQTAQALTQAGSTMAQDRTLGGDMTFAQAFTDPEFWLGQIPFTVYDAVQMSRAKVPTAAEIRPQLKKTESTPVRPYEVPRSEDGADEAQLEALLGNFRAVHSDPNATPEMRSAALKAVTEGINNPEAVAQVAAAKASAAARPTVDAPVTLTGRVDKISNGNYRVLIDDIETPYQVTVGPGDTVFVNGADPIFDPETGRMVFKTQIKNLGGKVINPLTEEHFGVVPTQWDQGQQPDLTNISLDEQGRQIAQTMEQGLAQADAARAQRAQPFQLSTNVVPPPRPKITAPEVAALGEMGVPAPTLARIGSNLAKASDPVLDWFQGKINVSPDGQVLKLGNKDVPAKGVMPEGRFVSATQLPKEFVAAMKLAYPEAFSGGNVDVNTLVKGLKERPMVEVRKLGGEGKQNAIQQRQNQITHILDTEVGPRWRQDYEDGKVTGSNAALVREWYALQENDTSQTLGLDQSSPRYSFLGPKPESEMPGYVEGLVRVPIPESITGEPRNEKLKYFGPHFGDEDENVLAFFRGYEETQPDGRKVFHVIEVQSDWGQAQRSLKEHVAEELVKNQEILARKKAEEVKPTVDGGFMYDWEYFQSHEAAEKSKEKQIKEWEEIVATNLRGETRTEKKNEHPLLAVYETLALKAAVDHARSVGADGIKLSDKATAMMTEGHDKDVWSFVEKKFKTEAEATAEKRRLFDLDQPSTIEMEGEKGKRSEKWVVKIKAADAKPFLQSLREKGYTIERELGMEGAYDIRLPDILAKLTGDEGERVEVGVHKQSGEREWRLVGETPTDWISDETVVDRALESGSYPGYKKETRLPGSPVFKAGEVGKTSISGRLYSLSKITGGLSEDSTLSLKEAVMKYEQAQQREKVAREKAVAVPTKAEEFTDLVDIETAKPKIDAKIAEGATPTQAVESVRLQTQTPIVDDASMDVNVQKDVVHETVSETAQGTEQAEYGAALKDEFGNRRKWRNPAEAEAYADQWKSEHPEDPNTYKVRDDNRGFYYLAPKENIRVQFDAGAEGTGHENILASQEENLGRVRAEDVAEEVMDTPVESRHATSKQAMLVALDVAERNADTFAEFVDPDIVDEPPAQMVAKARVALQVGEQGLDAVNAELAKRGIESFESLRDMTTQMRELLRAAGMFQDRYRNVSLDSIVPGDELAAREMGLDKGVHGLARYLATQKESLGVVADIMEAIVQANAIPADVVLQVPGVPGHDAGGWWMTMSHGGILKPVVNVPHWPSSTADMGRYHMNAAHEIVHTTEDALASRNDPAAKEYGAKRIEVLEAMRNTKAVPAKVRATVAKLVKEDAYGRLLAGKLSPTELQTLIMKGSGKENRDLFSYVYGMLHPQEMIAVMFSDPRVIEIARTTSMKQPQGLVETALTWLSKAFNKLVGGKDSTDSALATMLASYDNYLTGGVMRKVYNGAKFVRDGLVASGVRPEALASRMQTIDRMFVRGTLDASVTGFQREAVAGTLPATAKVGELAPDLLTSLRAAEASAPYDATMSLLADQLPVHQELLHRMREDIRLTDDLVKAIESGEVPGSIPAGVKDALGLSRAKLSSMEKAMRKQELALARWNNLDTFDPMGWEARVAEGLTQRVRNVEPPDEVPDAGDIRSLAGVERLNRGLGGKVKNWLQQKFMLNQFLKEVVPSMRPVMNAITQQQGLANQQASLLRLAHTFNSETGKAGDESVRKSNERVAGNKAMIEAYSDLRRWVNREGQMQALDLADPTVKGILERFNPNDRKAILQLVESGWARHRTWVENVLPARFGEINRDYTADLIAARSPGMLPDQARELGTKIHEALRASTDPNSGLLASELLRDVASQMTPATFQAALRHATKISQATAEWIQSVRDNPGYANEQRRGSDMIYMLNPTTKKIGRWSGTNAEMRAKQAELTAQGYKFVDYIQAEETMRSPTQGFKQDFVDRLQALDALNTSLAQELLADMPDVAARVLPLMQRSGDVLAELNANTPLPNVPRKFAEGRESINMLQNEELFYGKMNNYIKNKSVRAATQLLMRHPEIEGNREVQNHLRETIAAFTAPDSPLAQKIVSSTYFYKLAFDIGNAMLELSQSLFTGMTELVAETGSVTDSFGLTTKAIGEIMSNYKNKKWSSPELNNFMELANAEGHIQSMIWSDIADQDVTRVADVLGDKSPASFLKNGARGFSQFFSKYNNEIALIAGREIGMEKGLEGRALFDFAVDFKNRAAFTGGKAQRPGFFHMKTRAVPQLMSALTTYSLGWFSQMARNYIKGFGNAPAGTTPHQRSAAKKAFLYSIVAQAALAGALGLPGVGQGLALLGQATDTDPKGWLRQNLAKLFDEDQEAGGVLTSLALRGVGSAGLPFDPSGRASISVPFLGVDAYKGFDVANLGGAATSTFADWVEGMMGLLQGDRTAGAKLLPNVAKRPFQLWQGEWDIRDKRGGLMVDLNPAEVFMMSLGVTPSRVQTQRDASDALNKANRSAQREREALVDGLATQLRSGQKAEVQQAVIQFANEHPSDETKALVRAIQERYAAQTTPYDWRRDLNPGVELAGLVSPQPSTELLRRQRQAEAAQLLGVPYAPNLAEDYRASMVDSLLNSNPLMTRREARRAVSRKPAVQSPYTWLSN